MLQNEITSIYNEYASYFVHASVEIDADSQRKILHIVTREMESFLVGVCTGGWFECGQANPQLFETFEALMNKKSPKFRDNFAVNLFSRLEALADSDST